ncbi:MAG: 4-hydroxyproline epimerase [Acetobacteraceae bacterium]
MARHTFFCIDAHTGGNPVRVVAGGGPLLPAVPMAEKRQIFLRDHDWVRRALMFEPRGHDVMSGSILYPSTREDCEVGVLFIEVSGCLPMCGHGTIGTVTVAIEEGLVQPRVPGRFAIEAPAGRVEVEYRQEGRFVEQVRLFNVPAYLHAADVTIDVPGLGPLVIDVAYGGNFYAIIEPQPGWAGLDTMTARDLVNWSPAVRRAAQEAVAAVHPEDPRIAGVSHVMWCGPARDRRAHARNAVFYAPRRSTAPPAAPGPRRGWRSWWRAGG